MKRTILTLLIALAIVACSKEDIKKMEGKVDVTEPRNLCIISVVMTFGIGNMFVNVGDAVSLKGISLCAIVAIVLNLILPKAKNEVE